MVKCTRLLICVFMFTSLLSACTMVTPVPIGRLGTSIPTSILPATPTESRSTVATAQGTAQSKDTSEDCPPPSETVDIAPQYYGRAVGSSPVWAIINKPALVFSLEEIGQAPLSEHGYPYKVLWVVEKNYSGKVLLQGGNLEDETPLWFKIGGAELTTTPMIDPLHPGAFSNSDYSDFPSYVFIPGTGCYFIEASWNQESWRINLLVTQ